MSVPVTSRDVVAGGHKLRLYESGSKDLPPVLWLHGSGPGVGAMSNWWHLMVDLASDFYNIAPDILGFGDSDCPDPFPRGATATVDLRARNTLQLIDELELDAVHVVGNSMGGMIALRMAQLAPERLRKIVLMGSGGAGGLTPEAGQISARFGANPSVENMKVLFALFVYDLSAFNVDLDELAAERLKVASRPGVARCHAATYDLSQPLLVFSEKELAELPHEALVIHGREDRVLSSDGSIYLSRHLPNAQLHIFPRSGHWAQLELHDKFSSFLKMFISGAL